MPPYGRRLRRAAKLPCPDAEVASLLLRISRFLSWLFRCEAAGLRGTALAMSFSPKRAELLLRNANLKVMSIAHSIERAIGE